MMNRLRTASFVVFAFLLAGAFAMTGCDKEATVESGTYEGTIAKVNPDEDEIYVDADGQELELYFTEETELTRGGEEAEFDALEKGQTVEVEVEKTGQRLDPVSVEIKE